MSFFLIFFYIIILVKCYKSSNCVSSSLDLELLRSPFNDVIIVDPIPQGKKIYSPLKIYVNKLCTDNVYNYAARLRFVTWYWAHSFN